MALYQPDYQLIEAQKIIKKLDELDKKEGFILYYINHLKGLLEEANKRNEKYQRIFNLMSEFLPDNISRPLI